MKKILFLFVTIYSFTNINAQYSTPGTGVVWNMDSLALYSSGVNYFGSNIMKITEDITISENDSLYIIDRNIIFTNGIQVTVSGGSLYVLGGLNSGILTADGPLPNYSYNGFRLEGNSNVLFDNVTINGCGGIKVLTPNFIIKNSTIENNPTGINTGGFISVSTGSPQIINNTFRNNEVSAISSAANATVAPVVKNNIFESNVTSNTNRPQINLSPSGVNDTTFIENNTITGSSSYEMSGGIAFSALAGGFGNVVIRNNTITNNRYGITVLGNNLSAIIDNNVIANNNTQNNPNLGGSGINFNGNTTSLALISNNEISGNLWGITVLGTFSVNLGDSHIGGNNIGLNSFSENVNGGQSYALFNNTPNPINATNNCWEKNLAPTLQNAENVIYHNVDDNTLGVVTFDPIMLCDFVGVEEDTAKIKIAVFPNPVKETLFITLPTNGEVNTISVCNLNGSQILIKSSLSTNKIELDFSSLVSGVYFVKIAGENFVINEKVIKL